MKKYITIEEIKKIFSDPNLLKKSQKIWGEAEKEGITFIKHTKLERKIKAKEKGV
ncbi:hypothetical protein M1O51_02630 [Dehalococcoidia bacterium]|nr:hypothetical protein [Dehalococcoidia bacterium]